MSSKQTYSICCCIRRKFKLKEAEIPAEIKELFEKYSENGTMSFEHFQKFMKEVQGEDLLTSEEAGSLLESFHHEVHKHLNIFHHRTLHLADFFRFLMSLTNSPLPLPPKVPFSFLHVNVSSSWMSQ